MGSAKLSTIRTWRSLSRWLHQRCTPALAATLVIVAATPPQLAGAQTAAACSPGGAPVTFSGDAAPADMRSYLVRPFEVVAGTTRVEITYKWADKPLAPGGPPPPSTPLSQTVIDLGLWDQHGYRAVDGFRGWSGSREGRTASGQDPVFVQQDVAQRGYRPGPIEAGTWWVELGYGAVAPTGATWSVTVTCSAPAVGAPFVSRPVDPGFVANPNPGWYRGDFHMHGVQSNPRAPTYQQEVDFSRAAGLDFLPLTEYVTNQHWREVGPVQAANPDVLLWPSREVITYYGHAVVLGETPSVIDYRHGFEDVNLADIQARSKSDGALFQVAHPTTFAGPLFANFCRGCAFELGDVIDWAQVDTMEVLTGPVLVDSSEIGGPPNPVQIQNPFTRGAIDLWVNRLLAGFKITAVSGSDSKGVEANPNNLWGTNATVVYARELSQAALRAAIEAGHAYVQTRGARRSPTLEMTAVAPDGGTVMFGDTLFSDRATMNVRVVGAEGQLLTIYRNGQVVDAVPVTSGDFTYGFDAERSGDEGPLGTFYRVETADAQSLTTIGNPIFLADPSSPGRLGAARAGNAAGAAGTAGAGTAVGRGLLATTGDSGPRLLISLALAGLALVALATVRRSPRES